MSDKQSFGKATIGYGTSTQREIDVVDFVQAKYKGNRLISISELEDGGYILAVENPNSSGRNPHQNMLLSRESMIGLISTAHLYFQAKGWDVTQEIANSLDDGNGKKEVEFSCSPNLTAPKSF